MLLGGISRSLEARTRKATVLLSSAFPADTQGIESVLRTTFDGWGPKTVAFRGQRRILEGTENVWLRKDRRLGWGEHSRVFWTQFRVNKNFVLFEVERMTCKGQQVSSLPCRCSREVASGTLIALRILEGRYWLAFYPFSSSMCWADSKVDVALEMGMCWRCQIKAVWGARRTGFSV